MQANHRERKVRQALELVKRMEIAVQVRQHTHVLVRTIAVAFFPPKEPFDRGKNDTEFRFDVSRLALLVCSLHIFVPVQSKFASLIVRS